MNYLQWNNAIGKCFFNSENAEQEVHLFVSKHDMTKIGREQGLEGDEENIFLNYIDAIKKGLPGKPSNGNILEESLYAYIKWEQNPAKIDGIAVKYPLYIGYLALFVLPLTENNHSDLRVDAYYPRVKSFLKKYGLPSMPAQNERNNWNCMWDDLFNWSFEKMNTELGYFEIHPFQNEKWVYVGKPLSQSIFPIQAIRKLPQFFETSGLVPGEELESNTFRKLLTGREGGYLGLPNGVIKAIRDPDNELGQSIISITKKNYHEWTGSTDEYDFDNEIVKKGYTIAQLCLCLEGDEAKGFKAYLRLYTKLDFPEDLIFLYKGREYKCQQSGKDWSKPLFLTFSKGMELRDDLNKWKAKLPEKNIRLLIEGKNFHLSGWVEVPYMITARMLLMSKVEQSSSIEEWGECFLEGDFKKLLTAGIPDGYILYEINNPPIDHPDIPALQFKPDKKIIITGGIKTGVRTWLKDLLPDVELENGRGIEAVYLLYENSNERIYLRRKDIDQPVWVLPSDIRTDRGFYIKVGGDEVKGEQLKNYIIDSAGEVYALNDAALPCRDKFGKIINKKESESYVIGSKLLAINDRELWLRQLPYIQYFRPLETHGKYIPSESSNLNDIDSLLVSFLTIKGISNVKDYYEAFESVYLKRFNPEEIESHSIELSRLKRWSLNYLDYMGILDYEYSTKRIVVNPPKFLLIPTRGGRKVLLIGGRTSELTTKIGMEAEKEGLKLSIEPKDSSLTPFILPPAIIIYGFDESSGNNIELRFKSVAEACSISFDPDKLPQFRLAEFSGNIDEYTNQLTPDTRFDDSGWPARVFDFELFGFIPVDTQNIDKSFSLVEYRLTEYSFRHRLWINGAPYPVNKNWGRYIILNHFRKEIIFNDRERDIIAIPAALPLPRLISEAMTLFSGKAPKRIFLEINGIRTWFNVYENIPPIFATNYFRKVGQTKKELIINL
jgi:hypothetical protein